MPRLAWGCCHHRSFRMVAQDEAGGVAAVAVAGAADLRHLLS
jgi:hypothetical protein